MKAVPRHRLDTIVQIEYTTTCPNTTYTENEIINESNISQFKQLTKREDIVGWNVLQYGAFDIDASFANNEANQDTISIKSIVDGIRGYCKENPDMLEEIEYTDSNLRSFISKEEQEYLEDCFDILEVSRSKRTLIRAECAGGDRSNWDDLTDRFWFREQVESFIWFELRPRKDFKRAWYPTERTFKAFGFVE